MELTPAAQMGRLSRCRAAITAASAEKSAEKPATGLRTDRLRITRQAVSYLQEQDRIAREVANIVQRFTANNTAEEQGKTEDEMLSEELKVKERCQKIMARLMKGDKVPPKDDMAAYKLAMAARMMAPKKKPKEWDSVLKDGEEQSGGAESGGAVSAGAAETAEASGGGEAGVE